MNKLTSMPRYIIIITFAGAVRQVEPELHLAFRAVRRRFAGRAAFHTIYKGVKIEVSKLPLH